MKKKNHSVFAKRTARKAISILLAIITCFSIVSTTVFAVEYWCTGNIPSNYRDSDSTAIVLDKTSRSAKIKIHAYYKDNYDSEKGYEGNSRLYITMRDKNGNWIWGDEISTGRSGKTLTLGNDHPAYYIHIREVKGNWGNYQKPAFWGIECKSNCHIDTLKKNMRSLMAFINNSNSSSLTTNENGVKYTYYKVTLDSSSLDSWLKSVKNAESSVMFSSQGVIVAKKVLKTKTVTWEVPRSAVEGGPAKGTVSQKYKVPVQVLYKLHKHERSMGYGAAWYFTSSGITTVYSCNCGYRKEMMEWEFPLPDTSDAQTTKSVISNLPQIN